MVTGAASAAAGTVSRRAPVWPSSEWPLTVLVGQVWLGRRCGGAGHAGARDLGIQGHG